MACILYPCGQPDLAAAQILTAINGVPFVGNPPYSFDIGNVQCCNGVVETTFTFQNTLFQAGQGVAISIDGDTYQQICWFVGHDGKPCLDSNCNGQLSIVYPTGPVPYQAFYDVKVVITPDCQNCCVSDLQQNPNKLVFYIGAGPIQGGNLNDICCQVTIDLGYNIDNRVYTLLSPITAQASTCQCVDRTIQIRNDSCENKDMNFSLLSCNGYLSLIGQTSFLGVVPQQIVQLTLRYCPLSIETTSCSLVLQDDCINNDILFPISVSSVPCPPEEDICLNCDMLSINNIQFEPCDEQCVNIGDTILIYGNVGFPIRTFNIIAADNVLNTFTISGDFTAGFVAGTIFDISGSTCNDGTYTVLSSTFNGTNTIITVTTPVPCNTPDGAIENVQFCEPAEDPCDPCVPAPCFQEVHVTITNDDTGQVVFDQTFTAISNNVLLNIQHIIATFGTYHVVIEACDCFGCRKCEWFLEACFEYEIKKTGCHSYNVIDNQVTPTKINTVVVTNQDNTYSATYTFDTSIINFVAITLPEDGIYTVTISNNFTTDTQQFVIFDLCDFITCYRKLILDLFCNEADPCCKECNEEQKKKMQFQRAELNKMIALAGTLFAFIERDRILHLGIFTVDECRELDLQMIGDIFDKLNEITFRCGECTKTTPLTPQPCPTC